MSSRSHIYWTDDQVDRMHRNYTDSAMTFREFANALRVSSYALRRAFKERGLPLKTSKTGLAVARYAPRNPV